MELLLDLTDSNGDLMGFHGGLMGFTGFYGIDFAKFMERIGISVGFMVYG